VSFGLLSRTQFDVSSGLIGGVARGLRARGDSFPCGLDGVCRPSLRFVGALAHIGVRANPKVFEGTADI
jgi:hypothetical protein